MVAQKYGKEVITIGPLGEDPQQIIHPNQVGPGNRASWSADGSRLAFTANVYPDDDPVLGVVDADGGNLRIYPRIRLELGDPVMAPDGRSAAFARIRVFRYGPDRILSFRMSVWSFDFQKRTVRRLTRWRDEYLLPSSYSPDGSTLAATRSDGRRFRAVAIDLRTRRTSLLARNAAEPIYAPDGSSFAFVRWKPWEPNGVKEEASSVGELRVGRVGAPVGARLLRMRGLLVSPSWDPSGQRLAFVHSPTDDPDEMGIEEGNRGMAINVAGTCLTKVLSDPDMTLYGAAWQPGIGREAGPITC